MVSDRDGCCWWLVVEMGCTMWYVVKVVDGEKCVVESDSCIMWREQ